MSKNKPKNQNKKTDEKILELTYKHLWGCFELNATQRVSLFRYYVIFFTAYGASIYHTYNEHFVSIILSALFFLITAIFYLIEKRNNTLVENARNGLRKFEKDTLTDDDYKILSNEQHKSMIKHSHCYTSIFLIGIIVSTSIMLCTLHNITNSNIRSHSVEINKTQNLNEVAK